MRRQSILSFVLAYVLLAACGSNVGNQLTYAGPVEQSIELGQLLPGTDIQYLGKTERGAHVSLGGVEAHKKIGDSLDWEGNVISGVFVDQALRVAVVREERLHAAGTAKVVVSDPLLQPEPAPESAPVHFKLPVAYHVRKGGTIPGSTIGYLGQTDEGAHLSNVEGYAYRKIGDSIVWEGRLREGIWIELSLRAALISGSHLDVIGTADLWITLPEE